MCLAESELHGLGVCDKGLYQKSSDPLSWTKDKTLDHCARNPAVKRVALRQRGHGLHAGELKC